MARIVKTGCMTTPTPWTGAARCHGPRQWVAVGAASEASSHTHLWGAATTAEHSRGAATTAEHPSDSHADTDAGMEPAAVPSTAMHRAPLAVPRAESLPLVGGRPGLCVQLLHRAQALQAAAELALTEQGDAGQAMQQVPCLCVCVSLLCCVGICSIERCTARGNCSVYRQWRRRVAMW